MTIYYIRNEKNGKNYVGQTIRKVEKRWGEHKKSLQKGNHWNLYLQSSWKKHGEDNFTFGILASEITTVKELNRLEEAWVIALQAMYYAEGYNIRAPGGNERCAEITKEQISKTLSGRVLSEIHKNNLSEAGKGRTFSEETKRKISKSHKGKSLTLEHKKKISKACGGSPIKHIPTGEVYCSQHEAARKVGCSVQTVSNHCNNKVQKARFKYVENQKFN